METLPPHIAGHIAQYGCRLLGNLWKKTWRILWKIWTWIWLFGECSWIHLFEQRFISEKTMNEANWRYVKNYLWKTTGQLVRETEKLVSGQTETAGISLINFQDLWWMSTSLLHSRAYQYSTAKVHVFSDSVICLGKMGDDPVESWKKQIQWYSDNNYFKDLNRIDGQLMGFTTVGILNEIQQMMTEPKCEPEKFTGRIIFMSMFNDTVWDAKGNNEVCVNNSKTIKNYARRFPRGPWSFPGPRSSRWISYIHHTSAFKQHCHVGNTAQQCRFGLFQDSDFAGDLEDSKSTSGGHLCIFGSRTFVPISWMCKKQTSVSHSSTEAEIISLDAGLRMSGIPALDLWDLVIEVFHSSSNQLNNTKDQVQGNLSRDTTSNKHTHNKTKVPTSTTILIWTMLIVCHRTRSFLDLVRCCTSWRIPKPWLKWSLKAEVLQWDVFPEPTELLLIGCLTELIWTPRFKSSMSTPNTNLQTYWQREFISHVMNGIIFCVCSSSAISAISAALRSSAWPAAPKRWRKGCKNNRIVAKTKPTTMNLAFCLDKFLDCDQTGWVEKPGGYWKHPVEQFGQVQGNLTQEIAITTQSRVLKDGKKMHFWT